MSSRRERKERAEDGRQRQAAGFKPPHRTAMTPVAEATSPTIESSPLASPSQASQLAGAARESRKLVRLRRKGDLTEFKRELVGEVRRCSPALPAAVQRRGEFFPAAAGEERGDIARALWFFWAQVFKSCTAIANLNCNLDQPTPLGNDGAALVGIQLAAGCT